MPKDLEPKQTFCRSARQPLRRALCAAVVTLGSIAAAALSAQADESEMPTPTTGALTQPLAGGAFTAWPTLGGRQFWIDRRYHAGWRVQQNVFSGHYRLLDPADRRHAWGRAPDVLAAFAARHESEQPTTSGRRMVVLLHGWGRSRTMFAGLADALNVAGYEVVRLSYPSTQGDLERHARDLAAFLGRLEGQPQVAFVTHSLGAMVLRRMLADRPRFANGIVLDRAVLIAPPNQGAEMARRLHGFPPFDWLGGPVGADLLPAVAKELPAPSIPFMVIAGARGTAAGWNPLVPGDDDGIVALEEARLVGADAFLVVPSIHSFIVNHPKSIAASLSFLGRTGETAAQLQGGGATPIKGE